MSIAYEPEELEPSPKPLGHFGPTLLDVAALQRGLAISYPGPSDKSRADFLRGLGPAAAAEYEALERAADKKGNERLKLAAAVLVPTLGGIILAALACAAGGPCELPGSSTEEESESEQFTEEEPTE